MATSRSTPAARWGCFPPTSWRRFRREDACWRGITKPHSGQAQWRLGRKGAKATILLGGGDGKARRNVTVLPGRDWFPSPSPAEGVGYLVLGAASLATPQVQPLRSGKRMRLH